MAPKIKVSCPLGAHHRGTGRDGGFMGARRKPQGRGKLSSEDSRYALENRATTALAAGNQPRSAQPNNLAEAETHHD